MNNAPANFGAGVSRAGEVSHICLILPTVQRLKGPIISLHFRCNKLARGEKRAAERLLPAAVGQLSSSLLSRSSSSLLSRGRNWKKLKRKSRKRGNAETYLADEGEFL